MEQELDYFEKCLSIKGNEGKKVQLIFVQELNGDVSIFGFVPIFFSKNKKVEFSKGKNFTNPDHDSVARIILQRRKLQTSRLSLELANWCPQPFNIRLAHSRGRLLVCISPL